MSDKLTFGELIQSETPVLVDFSAEWCGPCKMLAPILQEMAGHFGERLKIVKIDVDRNPGPAAHFQITGVPTMILFKQGNILWRQSGVVPAYQLKPLLEQKL